MGLSEIISSFVLFLICAFCALIWYIYKKSALMYKPMRRRKLELEPDDYKLAYEKIVFSALDNVLLKGWFIYSDNPEASETIILCHGRGSNKSELLKHTHFLAEKYNLFYFDFRACGESKGDISPIRYMETRDFDAAYDFLRTNKASEADKIAVFGVSAGAAAAIYGAAKYPEIPAVVAESAFLSLHNVVYNWCKLKMKACLPFVPLALAFSRRHLKTDPEAYSPIIAAPKLRVYVLFINGDNDALVPAEDRKKLFEICQSIYKEKFIIVGAGHNQCAETGGMLYRKRILDFFAKVFPDSNKKDFSRKKRASNITKPKKAKK